MEPENGIAILIRKTAVWMIWMALVSGCAYTPKIRDDHHRVNPKSIAAMERITIGGLKQCILLRGADTANPVLLYVHGGPGKGEMPLIRSYDQELENHFTVATWDQRGAGRTNRILKPVSDFRLESYLSDTYEMVKYLQKRFGQNRIFMAGHSWGALLGIQIAYHHPEDFYAFIAIGQPVGMWENIVLAYRKALKFAQESGNKKVLKKLEGSGIDGANISELPRKDIIYVRKYINSKTPNRIDNRIYSKLVWRSIWSTEYSMIDVLRYLAGIKSSMDFLEQNNIADLDMYKLVPELKMPYFILAGIQDVFTDLDLTRAYFDFLTAPYKKFYVFEKSTHHPPYEEPEKYLDILINEVKPVGLGHQPNRN